MAYLYFSSLNLAQKSNNSSLYAATSSAALIFSFENDKSILDILKGQELLQELIGEKPYAEIRSLSTHLLSIPHLNNIVADQSIYIGLVAGKDRDIDLLYSTQITQGLSKAQLLNALRANKIQVNAVKGLTQITLPDSTVFYIGTKDNLLLLSNDSQTVNDGLKATFQKNKFAEYIKSNSRLTKNSVAEVYINFATLPTLLKNTMPGKLTGELAVLEKQQAFASLVYNFSKEKVLLTGATTILDEGNSYFQLFADLAPQSINITNILPQHTASYSVFAMDNYTKWRKDLNGWFARNKEDKLISKMLDGYNKKYHLDLEQIFPKYFKNQLISFQLSTTEKIGAIQLTNGDKVHQLLIDLSADYADDIKVFKEPDLLYSYFGAPFKKFKRPYYTIIDNYLVFSNNASSVQSFLNSYRNNRLLIHEADYSHTVNQLPNTANASFYIDIKNSGAIFSKHIYLPYYRHINSKTGLKEYTAFIYQMSGENGKFQTNLLLNKLPAIPEAVVDTASNSVNVTQDSSDTIE